MAMDVAMDDVDMDIDFDLDPEVARLNAEADAIRASAPIGDAMNGVEEPPEEGEVDASAAVPNKIHLRGLNNLNTNQVKQYAGEHFSLDLFAKIEWVDDTSANLIYDTELAAAEALAELSAEECADPLQLRTAKRLSTHPDIELFVRQAIVSDVKAPNARFQSRFYLLNREWDPESRPAKRRRPDYGYNPSKYRRREYEDEQHHRRGSKEEIEFHEDMYDERPAAAAPRKPNSFTRRGSFPSDGDNRRRRPSRGSRPELLPERSSGRLRDRSASPARDGDGRYGFAEDQPRRMTARARSRTPPRQRGERDYRNRSAGRELRKELFPDRRPSSSLHNGYAEQRSVQNNNHDRPFSSGKAGIELFPDKAATHRRQDAKDLHPDEVADAIGQYTINGDEPQCAYNGSPGHRPASNGRQRNGGGREKRDLFERIGGAPRSVLRDEPPRANGGENGFAFKGASGGGGGFNFRGASKQESNGAVKELFPRNGRGDGRLIGRGAPGRNRAEDFD